MSKEENDPKPVDDDPQPDDPTLEDDDDLDDEDNDPTHEPEPKKSAASDKVDRAELNRVIQQRQDLKRKLKEAQKAKADLERASETESEKARREAAEEAAAKVTAIYKPALVKKEAATLLLAEGVKKEKINRLVKLMELDEIDVDANMNVMGVDDEVARLKAEYPELFGVAEEGEQAPKKRRAPQIEKGGSKSPEPQKNKPMENLILEGLRGDWRK